MFAVPVLCRLPVAEPSEQGPDSNAQSSAALRRGIGLSAVAALLGAAFLIPYQAAVERGGRGSAVLAMLVCAAVFNSAVALVRRKQKTHERNLGFKLAVFLAVMTVIGNVAVAGSLPQIGAGMTSVVLKAQVVITPLLAWLFIKERLERSLLVAIVFAGAGVVVMRGASFGQAALFPMWALLAALVFAGMQVGIRQVVLRIEISSVNALRLWLAAAVLFVLPGEWGAGLSHDPGLWLLAGTAGVLGPGMSRLLLMTALRSVTPSTTAHIALVGPVFAFVLAYLFFGDVPTAVEVLGALLILFGVAWPLIHDRWRGPVSPAPPVRPPA